MSQKVENFLKDGMAMFNVWEKDSQKKIDSFLSFIDEDHREDFRSYLERMRSGDLNLNHMDKEVPSAWVGVLKAESFLRRNPDNKQALESLKNHYRIMISDDFTEQELELICSYVANPLKTMHLLRG